MAAIDFPAGATTGQTFAAGNGVVYTFNGTIWLASGNSAGGDFMATNSANVSIVSASVFQALTLDTIKSGNVSGAYSTSTGRYTPPAGRYLISIGFTGVNGTAAFQLRCALRKNGVDDGTQSIVTLAGAGYFGTSTYEAIVDANGTDYFQMFVYSHITSTVVQLATAWFIAFPISGIKGPPGDATPGTLIQTVSTQTGAVATGTTVIPVDDTIPQITEGDQYMTLAITPKSTTSKLIIEVVAQCASNVAGTLTSALFQDSTANALAAIYANNAVNNSTILTLRHTMTSGTTSATTFRVRIGSNTAGTTTLNGVAAGRIFGGLMASSIVIQEVAP